MTVLEFLNLFLVSLRDLRPRSRVFPRSFPFAGGICWTSSFLFPNFLHGCHRLQASVQMFSADNSHRAVSQLTEPEFSSGSRVHQRPPWLEQKKKKTTFGSNQPENPCVFPRLWAVSIITDLMDFFTHDNYMDLILHAGINLLTLEPLFYWDGWRIMSRKFSLNKRKRQK